MQRELKDISFINNVCISWTNIYLMQGVVANQSDIYSLLREPYVLTYRNVNRVDENENKNKQGNRRTNKLLYVFFSLTEVFYM